MKYSSNVSAILFFSLSQLAISCVSAEEMASYSEHKDIVAKNLATIGLSNGLVATFKAEEDGIVYEESGPSDIVGHLTGASMLERFLALTDDDVEVPQDLIDIEEDQMILQRARYRGIVDKHFGVLTPDWVDFDRIILNNGTEFASEFIPAYCNLDLAYYDTDTGGAFYRMYTNYPWGHPGTTVYSSWKSGADKAKTINVHLINCSNTNILDAVTSYKNIFGNYKMQDSIQVNPTESKFWAKTYISKRYRRVFVSGFGSGSFSGFVLFTDY